MTTLQDHTADVEADRTVEREPEHTIPEAVVISSADGGAAAGSGGEVAVSASSGPGAPAGPRSAVSPWTDGVLWRRRAARLLGAWALLSLALVGLRVSTAGIRPELRDAVTARQELVKQRDALSLEVQTLGAASRVTQWAEEAGMLRFADSMKRSAEISGVGLPNREPEQRPVQMRMEWGKEPQTPPSARPEKAAEQADQGADQGAQEAPAP